MCTESHINGVITQPPIYLHLTRNPRTVHRRHLSGGTTTPRSMEWRKSRHGSWTDTHKIRLGKMTKHYTETENTDRVLVIRCMSYLDQNSVQSYQHDNQRKYNQYFVQCLPATSNKTWLLEVSLSPY